MQLLDWQLAWRNVWRHPRRTAVIGAAVFIGVWAMVFVGAFIKGMENDMIASNLAALTGHIQIHAPGYLADPAVGQSMTDPAALAAALKKALPPGARWAWRVRIDAVASNARHMGGLTLVGVQPTKEARVSFVKPDLIQGGFLVPKDDRGIIIGAALLDEYEAKVGHKIILTGQATDGELVARAFHIIGLYRAPLQAIEKQFGFVSLDAAQRMLKLGSAVSEVSIVLPDRNDSAAAAEELRRLLPEDKYSVKTWVELKPVLQAYLLIFQSFTMVWYLVMFAAMAFGVVNTVLMAVYERMKEFGLLKALGMKPGRMIRGVLAEAFILLLLGSAAGNLAGWLTVAPLAKSGVNLSALAAGAEYIGVSRIIHPALDPVNLILANLVVFVLGLAVSLYPAVKAARFTAVKALTRE